MSVKFSPEKFFIIVIQHSELSETKNFGFQMQRFCGLILICSLAKHTLNSKPIFRISLAGMENNVDFVGIYQKLFFAEASTVAQNPKKILPSTLA